MLIVATATSDAAAPKPQLLEYGRDAGLCSLAGNAAGDRVVVAPFSFRPEGPRLDVFTAAPGAPFGSASRINGATGPIFNTVAALGPDATAVVVGKPAARAGNIGRGVVALVRPPGGVFSGPQTLTAADADDPSVAFDRQGDAMAIWVRHRSVKSEEDYVEQSTRPNGGDWSAPVVISHEPHSAFTPQVAFDAAGGAVAVWTRNGVRNKVVAAVRAPGGAFGRPQVISDARFHSDEASLSVNSSGQAAVVWVLNTKNDAHFRVGGAFRAPGRAFGPPRFFTPARADATGASIALDDQGRALLTWRISNRKAPGGVSAFWIEVARRPPGGPIGRPVRASGARGEIGELAIAPSGRGRIAWIYHGRRGDLVQARTATTDGGLGPVTQISPRGSLDNLDSTIDASGAVTFVWTRLGKRGERLETTTTPPRGSPPARRTGEAPPGSRSPRRRAGRSRLRR